MSNKARNSKESILCDAKELMKLYDRVTWHLPKARREHSAVRRFEDAGYAIIHYCTIAMELKDKLSLEWWQWLEWDDKRKCITYKQGYSPNERLKIKYHLKLKHYDTIRNHRAEKCSLQRAQHAGVAA